MKRIKLKFILVFALSALGGGILLHVSQSVKHTQAELKSLDQKITSEREHIALLEAEWAYLNNPQYLEILAKKVLGFEPSHKAPITPDISSIPTRPDHIHSDVTPIIFTPAQPNPPHKKVEAR